LATENQSNVQHPDPRWPGRTAEEAAVLESIARSAGRKWAEENVDVILAQAQAAADAAWSPGLKKAVRRILVGIAVVIVAAGLILWYVNDDPSARVRMANFARIKPRMNLEEVSLVLGPPGDHRTAKNTINDSQNANRIDLPVIVPGNHPTQDVVENFWPIPRSINPTQIDWLTDRADVHVWFNDSGQAYQWVYVPMRIETIWDKVKRQWQRWFS
jgi:hypothetical protein